VAAIVRGSHVSNRETRRTHFISTVNENKLPMEIGATRRCCNRPWFPRLEPRETRGTHFISTVNENKLPMEIGATRRALRRRAAYNSLA
jgi:hypothetical protein